MRRAKRRRVRHAPDQQELRASFLYANLRNLRNLWMNPVFAPLAHSPPSFPRPATGHDEQYPRRNQQESTLATFAIPSPRIHASGSTDCHWDYPHSGGSPGWFWLSPYRAATAARKETIAELHVCRGLLTEYENHNGDLFITSGYSNFTGLFQGGNPMNPMNPIAGDMGNQSISPPSIRYGATVTGNNVTPSTSAVAATQNLMQILMQVPANRNVVLSIQSKRLLEPPTGSTGADLRSGRPGAA